MKQEDFELVERCKRGEERAYAELLQRHQDSVYNICRRLTRDSDQARDLAQEAFIRTFSRLDRYDPVYPFSAWLFKITANLCIDFLRRRRLRRPPRQAHRRLREPPTPGPLALRGRHGR